MPRFGHCPDHYHFIISQKNYIMKYKCPLTKFDGIRATETGVFVFNTGGNGRMSDHNHIASFFTTNQELENYLFYTKYFSDMLSRHQIDSGRLIYVSPSAKQLLHFRSYDLYGQSLYQFIHPDDLTFVKACFQEKANESGRVTYRLRRKEGDYIWVESQFKKIADTFSCPTASGEECFCVTRDIGEYKTAVEDMRLREQKYRTLVEHAHDTIGILSPEGHFIFLNESGKRLFGITRSDEVLGRSLIAFMHDKDKEKITNFFKNSWKVEEAVEFQDLIIVRTDRETRDVEIKFIPTHYRERRTLQVVIRDVTERKKTEAMLQQTEKLSVVGQLAAGIAHEIRNPLTAIKGFTQLLKDEINHKYSQVILQELDRIESIVSDLLILAKPQVSEIERADLLDLLNRVITLLNSQAILHNILIKLECDEEAIEIDCEPDKLQQVFINFIKNSIEAMTEDGGTITIKVRLRRPNAVDILFIDEGVGIPADRLEKVGEPFYSTKEKGTGLGLMICQKIIRSHHGRMAIESTVGVGTTITVTLPLKHGDRVENV